MFETLEQRPADSLLMLIKEFKNDPRPGKIDLGVGVFRDAAGNTPVLRAIKAAEKILLETQDTKKYLGPEGDLGYVAGLKKLLLEGTNGLEARLTGLQTPGGTGALRLGAELVHAARPEATLWIGVPTWPNHEPIMKAGQVKTATYPFIDLKAQTIDFAKTLETMKAAAPGDVFLLHGCCHNPTGADYSLDEWKQIAAVAAERKLVPFIDLAYQGLGDGLHEDAAGLRTVLSAVDEALVAYSCDKNFGMYRERVGGLYVLTHNEAEARRTDSNLALLARVNWSMPPDHGAAAVRIVLESAELTAMWKAELKEMGDRIRGNRKALAAAHPELGFIAKQKGLFSTLSMSKEAAVAVRQKHGVYITGGGRMNLAGMKPEDAKTIVDALVAEGCISAVAAAV